MAADMYGPSRDDVRGRSGGGRTATGPQSPVRQRCSVGRVHSARPLSESPAAAPFAMLDASTVLFYSCIDVYLT